MTPLRIQRRRTRGWRKPPGSVMCTRPGRWANPFRLSDPVLPGAARKAVERFQANLRAGLLTFTVDDVRRELKDQHLACYCRLCPKHQQGKPLDEDCADCAPCHVDVLGRVANS